MSREENIERILDRRIQTRLAHDRAYRNAENAEQQAEREDEIERQEWERLQRELRERDPRCWE